MTPAYVVTAARSWIGTPWSHQHRMKGVGSDCAGLVIGVAKELGLANPEVPAYSRQPSRHSLIKFCDQYMFREYEPALGRVAVMRFDNDPQHLGIFGDYPFGGLSLIHGHAKSRKVVEHRLDEQWSNRIVAIYSLPGID